MSSAERAPLPGFAPPLAAALSEVRDPSRSDWQSAWVTLTPAFTDKKTAKLWERLASTADGEDSFFSHKNTLHLEKSAAKALVSRYRQAQQSKEPWCLFDSCERQQETDPRRGSRRSFLFSGRGDGGVLLHLGMDAGTLLFRLEQVPLRWLYDPRFVRFLQELVWEVPRSLGLTPTLTAGGGEFAVSAKTYLDGSLLCDDLADRFNHPELACWTMDLPRAHSRSFRATRKRRAAFNRIIEEYWAGAFHPGALGPLRVENAFLERGFFPAIEPPEGLMTKETAVAGPVGSLQEVFQTNFAFGRALPLLAHRVHPGSWQKAHPQSARYRPELLPGYSEAALSRLAVIGELHDGAGDLHPDRIPEFAANLEQPFLDDRAAWEHRAHGGRTSAEDYVEALLHEVHRAQYLQHHPSVQPRASLLQDQLLADADETLVRHGGSARLGQLQEQARAHNLADSYGRIKSDFIEPETLFWEAWHILPPGERAAIAREVVRNFRTRIAEAASCDPRLPGPQADAEAPDPMAWHRHRIHPILWQAIEQDAAPHLDRDPILRELRQFKEHEALYLSRRPELDVQKRPSPWDKPQGAVG
ncbi:MAG TPA: hypothetical protein PLW65_18585 [Pseudomonadota bacterium]|nr:hypothetical protein [Pseudomonadota bacterium]